MRLLLVGRFHALTRGQADVTLALAPEATRLDAVITSCDHAGTRRNPLDQATRARILRPLLESTGRPFAIVPITDIPDDAAWPAHVAAAVGAASGEPVVPAETHVVTTNHAVAALFRAAGFVVPALPEPEVTPDELIARVVAGEPWEHLAAPSMRAVYDAGILAELRRVYADRKRTDDGELAAHRDFDSYGAGMDASLGQKLDDLVPWVVPGLIVDKGCGTGRLLVELSRRFPESAFVGVDLSREFLRRSAENTYAAEDVSFVLGDAADVSVVSGTASTVIFSSIMHEIYSYSGYDQAQVERALASAREELRPGGRLLVRDGVSPGRGQWRLRLLDEPTRAAFPRFAAEFKHGQGAPHERVDETTVRLAAHLANEFFCKKDYQRNWHIEVHEEYGVRTVDEWREALARHGFAALAVRAYVNPWLAEHRYRGKVALFDDAGAELPWPATNVVVVGEKR